jgi:hypothetical protein
MPPILIALFLVTPILVLGTWLYLRRRKLSPETRIVFMAILFLFVLLSGPVIFLMLRKTEAPNEILSTGRGGRRLFGQISVIWLFGVFGFGAQLIRLWRKKGEL